MAYAGTTALAMRKCTCACVKILYVCNDTCHSGFSRVYGKMLQQSIRLLEFIMLLESCGGRDQGREIEP